MNNNIIALLPFPPPYAGPEIANDLLLKTSVLKNAHIVHVNSNIRKENKDKGRFDLKGILAFLKIFVRIFLLLIRKRNKSFYFMLSSTKVGFIRDFFYIFLGAIFNKKLIAHYRGSNFNSFYLTKSIVFKKFICFVLLKLDVLILQGEVIRNNFISFFPKHKIEVLPNGLNFKKITITQSKDYNSQPFIILFMGHLIYSKGFHLVVESYQNLFKKYGRKIRLLFAGENIGFNPGTSEFLNAEWKEDFFKNGVKINNEVQDFIKNCEKHNAEYLGCISGKEKNDVLSIANVLVLPSFTEGFSMSVLEAMAYGKPVIVTPVGAMPEVVENGVNGIITPVGDSKMLEQNIEYFMIHPEVCREIGEYNREYVKKNFNIEVIAQKLLKILQDV